ncbi:MAG TPA: hypothetical protein VM243_20485 [Phycisphaerae bacterium]|nr:hypothetical protein [Phycisphaerae bacterium]
MPLEKEYIWIAAGVIIGLWLLRAVFRGWRRRLRARRPPRLNPKLQKYGDQADVMRARQEEAARIVATSTTDQIVGYTIVEQVEAVVVDGFRRPEEAMEGLKAAAAMKGANAVTHVYTERTSSGRCGARGDAVIVRKIERDA